LDETPFGPRNVFEPLVVVLEHGVIAFSAIQVADVYSIGARTFRERGLYGAILCCRCDSH